MLSLRMLRLSVTTISIFLYYLLKTYNFTVYFCILRFDKPYSTPHDKLNSSVLIDTTYVFTTHPTDTTQYTPG